MDVESVGTRVLLPLQPRVPSEADVVAVRVDLERAPEEGKIQARRRVGGGAQGRVLRQLGQVVDACAAAVPAQQRKFESGDNDEVSRCEANKDIAGIRRRAPFRPGPCGSDIPTPPTTICVGASAFVPVGESLISSDKTTGTEALGRKCR